MKKVLFIFLFSLLVVPFCVNATLNLSGKFDWNSPKVKKICPAISYFTMQLSTPREMFIAVMKVDLTDPKIKFQMTKRASNWGEKMPGFEKKFIIRTARETCRVTMKKYLEKNINMVAIINGSPWSPWQPPFNHPYADRQGLIIDNGQIVAPILPGRPAFVVTKDGQVFFKLMAKDTNISNYLHAISGFAFVLNDGEVIKSKAKSLAPRTGYGLSKDKKTLYLFVVDGRQPKYSMGMSTYEVGEFLQYLGAHTGLNMDGGGSSTLIIKDGNKLNMLNKQKWGERTVGGAMGLIYQ